MRVVDPEVKVGRMKPTLSLTLTRIQTSPSRRRQLLAAFERSGLTAAAFARQQGIVYTTFCAWRRRSAKLAMTFAEVELVKPITPEAIVVELGSRARVRLSSHAQLDLVTDLLQRWEATC
jgi:hypothetical protein